MWDWWDLESGHPEGFSGLYLFWSSLCCLIVVLTEHCISSVSTIFTLCVICFLRSGTGLIPVLSLTHRASFLTKTVPSGNELHKFLIWDTAGQERVSIHS